MIKGQYIFVLLLFINSICAQEICNNCIDDDGDGLIDCYDSECASNGACEDFFLQSLEESGKCHNDFNADILWENPDVGWYQSPLTGDVDYDGNTEVIAKTFDSVWILNGSDGSVKYKIANSLGYEMAMADVDKDGVVELFSARREYLGKKAPIFQSQSIATGNINWTLYHPDTTGNPPPSGYATIAPSIADFNGDGSPEIFACGAIVDAITGNLLVDFQDDYLAQGLPIVVRYVTTLAADVLPDSFCALCEGLEVVSGNTVYAVDVTTGNYAIASTAPIFFKNGVSAVADMDADGALDIVVADIERNLYIWNPRTGLLIGGSPYVMASTTTGLPLLINADEDPQLEIVVYERVGGGGSSGHGFITLVDDNLKVKWKNFDAADNNSNYSSNTAFDLNCDGFPEIVSRGDQGSLHIVDSRTGQTLMEDNNCLSATAGERPIIADVNDDGFTDILCVCPSSGGTKVWSGAVNGWSSSRSVNNQFGYYNAHINDDLTVPCHIPNHGDPSLPKQLNSFLQQAPKLNSEIEACLPDSSDLDLSLTVDTVIYRSCDSVNVIIRICNNSDFPINSSSLPYSYYSIDGNNDKYFQMSSTLGYNLDAKECRVISHQFEANNDQLMFYINDSGAINTAPPVVHNSECYLENNYAFVELPSAEVLPSFDVQDYVVCPDSLSLITVDLEKQDPFTYTTSVNASIEEFEADAYGLYWIEAKLSDQCNFRDTFNIYENTDCYFPLYIPNAFYLGVGHDNNWKVHGLPGEHKECEIYDRKGKLIFNASADDIVWDGTFEGMPVSSGVYIYQIRVYDAYLGIMLNKRGNITLTRY